MNYINSSFGSPLDSSSERFNSFLQTPQRSWPENVDDKGAESEAELRSLTPSVVFQNTPILEEVVQKMIESKSGDNLGSAKELRYSLPLLSIKGRTSEAPAPLGQESFLRGTPPPSGVEDRRSQPTMTQSGGAPSGASLASYAPGTRAAEPHPLNEVKPPPYSPLVFQSSKLHYCLMMIPGKQFSVFGDHLQEVSPTKEGSADRAELSSPLPFVQLPLTDSKKTSSWTGLIGRSTQTVGEVPQQQKECWSSTWPSPAGTFGNQRSLLEQTRGVEKPPVSPSLFAPQKKGAPLIVNSDSLSAKSDIEKSLTNKSKNILTLLFSIFIVTSGAHEGKASSRAPNSSARATEGAEGVRELGSRPKVSSPPLVGRRASRDLRSAPRLVKTAARLLKVTSGIDWRRAEELCSTSLLKKFIRKKKNSKEEEGFASWGVPPPRSSSVAFGRGLRPPSFISYTKLFPFFILLYSIIVGVQGSTQKVISHEKRVSSNIVNNKVYKRGSQPEVPQHSLVLSSSQELQASKLRELRFSEYSPLGLKAVLIGGPRTQFSTNTLNFFQKLLCKEASKSSARDSLAPENLRSPSDAFLVPQSSLIQKYFLEGVYISTQIFVFLTLQTLVSENNFGRNNPLKQKDSKSNQARILWPKQNRLKKFLFWKDNSQKQNKGIPDLPGIQEVTSLIEILVESLQNKKTGELRWRANNEVLGGRMVKAPRRSFAKGGTPLGQQSSSRGTSSGDLPPSRTGGHHLFVSEAHQISSFPKGYLFVGPPGTGKTLLAQEIAQLAQVPFICVSASEIQKQIEIGTRIGALRLRKLFQQAQSLSPCILFFDEIDAIAQRQSQHDSKLFTEFLIQMDGFQNERNLGGRRRSEGSLGVPPSPHSVILGTTNYLAKLDSAFVRSGRFDRILALTYPSKKIRFDILVFYIKKTQHKELLISSSPVPPSRSIDQKRGGQRPSGGTPAERSRALLTCATEATTSRSSGDRRSSTTSSKSDQTADRTADQRSQAPKDEIFASLGLNYFSFSTDGFSQAHLARLVNESLLFTISQKLGANLCSFGHSDQYGGEQLRSGQLRPGGDPRAKLDTNVLSDRRSGGPKVTGGRVPLHSFQSLLHGLKQMKRHRKNLPQDNMFIG